LNEPKKSNLLIFWNGGSTLVIKPNGYFKNSSLTESNG